MKIVDAGKGMEKPLREQGLSNKSLNKIDKNTVSQVENHFNNGSGFTPLPSGIGSPAGSRSPEEVGQ